MKHWKVIIKEVGHDNPIETEIHGNYEYNDVIEFFGLKQPDVEWYKIISI